jgi:hypothetical protein
MTPRLLAFLIAALVAAAALGVGIGIGAAIWEGGTSAPPLSPPAAEPLAPANAPAASWLFVVTADAGVVAATGGDALKIELRGTAPRAVAFTDRPQREAKAVKTPALWAALYADGAAPPNAALSFDHAGEAVVVPLEMLNVTGAAPNYTIAARALGAGGLSYLAAEMVSNGAAVVRGPSDPQWATLKAGLAVDAPELFIDDGSYGAYPPLACSDPAFDDVCNNYDGDGTCGSCYVGPYCSAPPTYKAPGCYCDSCPAVPEGTPFPDGSCCTYGACCPECCTTPECTDPECDVGLAVTPVQAVYVPANDLTKT